MGNRLSKIYTRTGDKGETGLGDGSRVSKSSLRIQAIGDTDELNSCLGLLASHLDKDDELQPLLSQIQHDLFDIGGEMAMPGYELLKDNPVEELEAAIDQYNSQLPPLKDFILPGGSQAASFCHLARSVSRRTERTMIALAKEDEVTDKVRQYLNRLSDLLFVLARVIARRNGGSEVLWQSRLKDKSEAQSS